MTLTEAIIGRMSHDLAGGVGAIASTAELMAIDPTFVEEAGHMLKQNSLMLMARLRFYRALFGAETKEINASILTEYLHTWGQKITFEGNPDNRLQLALVAVGIILLAQGGALVLKGNLITLRGPEITARPEFLALLNGEEVSPTPEIVEAAWLMKQLSDQKKTLKTTFKATTAQLEIK